MSAKAFAEVMLDEKNGAAGKLRAIKNNSEHPLYNNLAIKELIPIINNKEFGAQRVSNITLRQQSLPTPTINDLISSMEAIYKVDPELYKDIVVANYFQAGLKRGTYQLDSILPLEYRKELFKLLTATIDILPVINAEKFAYDFLRGRLSILPYLTKNNLFKNPKLSVFKKSIEGMGLTIVNREGMPIPKTANSIYWTNFHADASTVQVSNSTEPMSEYAEYADYVDVASQLTEGSIINETFSNKKENNSDTEDLHCRIPF
jgi:hypothetical protein